MNNQDYGFLPVVAGAGIVALLSAGVGYLIGKKVTENQYYECLKDTVARGESIENAKRICLVPFTKPTLIQQIAIVPLIGLFGYGIYKLISEGNKNA